MKTDTLFRGKHTYLNGMVITILLLGCSSREQKYQPITEDFCSQIQIDRPAPLTDQLAPLAELALTKTGVYLLEEGDVSMISRAWLCESAEKTIDIQYFIFSVDNIGLIASDYLLRAADRGVKVRVIVDDVMVEADADEFKHQNLQSHRQYW